MEQILVYTDGASRGNPGPAGIGVVIFDENGNQLCRHKEFIGRKTNNEAEYMALIKGLELAAAYCRQNVFCFSDSQLVVRQMNKKYRIRAANLLDLYLVLKQREKLSDRVEYAELPRENDRIRLADKLSKEAIKGAGAI